MMEMLKFGKFAALSLALAVAVGCSSKNGDENGDAGNGGDIPLHPQHVAAGADQIAPGGDIGVRQLEERQRAFEQDRDRHDDAGIDDHRGQGVGQDLTEDQLDVAQAQRPPGLHEFAVA